MGSADIELTRPGPCFSYKTMLLRVISAQSIHNVNTFMRQLSRLVHVIIVPRLKMQMIYSRAKLIIVT